MVIVDLVCNWNKDLVPSFVASLVAADQQHRGSPRIERIQHTIRASGMLHSFMCACFDVSTPDEYGYLSAPPIL